MGEVYRARDERLAREVAIKVLPAWAAADPEMLRRLEAEARAAGALNHPGILSIFDIGRADTGPFIVSELLSGETLRARLRRGALRVPDAVDFGQQIAQALAAAHEHGIVHRDLKPENLFVTTEGRVKILDFGIARLMPHASSSRTAIETGPVETLPGLVLGTYGYMSPEQANGVPVDHRADIFSLGAVLYEMLSGRPAFDGRSPTEIAHAVVNEEPDALTQGSPALQQVIRRCLAKDPAQRFQSARDLAFALGTAGPGAATPLTPPASATQRNILWAAVAAAVLVVSAFALGLRLPRPAGRSHISSLAVLPLANYSATAGEEYFADSMTEAMITDLAHISALTVTSRPSVMRYKGTKKSMREIARELGVDAVVEASFLNVGDRVQISANLVDGRTDRSLWTHKYEREMHNVLDLQSEVARAISREISVTLTPREQAYLEAARDVDRFAYEAYLRGRYELNRYTEASMQQALRHFGQAIQKDPRSARAYTGRSDTYSALRSVYLPPDSVMPQAKADAQKAIELDDSLAEGHAALGTALMYYDWNLKAAEHEFDRALELNGGLAAAHDGRAQLLAAANRPAEATAEIERTLRFDPLSPILRIDAAWVYYLAGRNELVIEQSLKAIELEPAFWMGYTMLGLGYEKLGRFTDATTALEKARSLDDSPLVLEMLGGLYATSGKHAEAQAVLKELHEQEKRRYVCAYEVATIYAGLGDRGNTLVWLEKGRKQRADCMPWAAVDPKLDRLRGDKDFQDLLHRLGTPPSDPASRQ